MKTHSSEKPLVSAIIASYNHAKYLPLAIESLLSQTYRNFEIIIVDDGSKDNSLKIAQEYAAKYPDLIQVYFHPNNANLGISNTVNLAYSLTKGKYWCGLPSDDVACKNKFEKQVEYLESHPDVGFVYGCSVTINSENKITNETQGIDITSNADILETLLKSNQISAPTVMMRREATERIGLHYEDLVYSDWLFWIQFAVHNYKIGFIPEVLVQYRVHDYNTSIGINPTQQYKNIREVYLTLQKMSRSLPKLSLPKYQEIIAEMLNSLPAREAQAHLDDYFLLISKKNYAIAKTALMKAYSLSPILVCRPRQLAAILKQAIINIK